MENTLITSLNKLSINEPSDDEKFWNKIIENKTKLIKYESFIRFMLLEYGTKEPCNRFDVGNAIEFALADFLRDIEFKTKNLPNAKRIDLIINLDSSKDYPLSIKYSSIGDITLHNSNSAINTDCNLTDLLLVTPDKLYLITNKNLKEYNIDVTKYIKNCGDSAKLKRTLLTELKKINFHYCMKINLIYDKDECKNKLCAELFYKMVKQEYQQLMEIQ